MHAQAETVFVRLLIPFIFGILTFYGTTNPLWQTHMLFPSLLLFFVLLISNIWYSRFRAYRYKPAILIAIYLLSFCAAGQLTLTHKDVLSTYYFAKQQADFLRVRITDEPQVKNNIIRLKTSVIQTIKGRRKRKSNGHLLVSIKLDPESTFRLAYGDELLIPSQFDTVQSAKNPYQFDTKSWLAQQNIHHQTFIPQVNVLKTATQTGNPLLSWAIQLRMQQIAVYNRVLKDPEAKAIASTLILGYRADLSSETLAVYSKTGTIHALSVSGMHVGLIYLVLQAALSFMDRRRLGKLMKLMLILLLIWFYALITGFSPSVLRSVTMLSIYVLAKTFNKQTNSYNILCFSAFCMLIYNPFLLLDVGFQLSYLSVFGLVYLQPKFNNWVHFKVKFLNKLWSALSLSLAAQLATFPLATYYFHQFPVLFLFSNLFILLPMSMIMYLGIILLLTHLYFLAPAFEWLINFTNIGLARIAELPYSVFTGIWLDRIQLSLLIISILLITFSLLDYRKKPLLAGVAMVVVLLGIRSYDKWTFNIQRRIVFFSLPRGTATAFIQGNQATLLSDLDSGSSTYKFYVEPLLMHNQITHIKFLDKHETYHYKQLQIKQHQISFCGQYILVADPCLNRKHLQTRTNAGILLLTENSKVNMQALLNQFPATIILIDGSNSAFFSIKMQEAAKNYAIASYNLKKLKAYLVNIKE